MRKLLATYFFAWLTYFSFGQSAQKFEISGIVVSELNGQPISDATIQYSKYNGVLTDKKGEFKIQELSAGRYTLTFTALGYPRKDTVISIYEKGVNNFRWAISTFCFKYNEEAAVNDIKMGIPLLLLQSGIAPVAFTSDKIFTKKYNVTFLDFGCVAGDFHECIVAYNKTIFNHLDSVYGRKWRKEIRKDIIGL